MTKEDVDEMTDNVTVEAAKEQVFDDVEEGSDNNENVSDEGGMCLTVTTVNVGGEQTW
jgi:hypothetical protein